MVCNETLIAADLVDFPHSPISSVVLNGIGFYLCALMVASSIVNAILFLILVFVKELKNPINSFVLAITCLNFFGTVVELPFVIGSNFASRWIFGHFGCVASAFIMYSVGCISVYLLVAVSVERLYTIHNPTLLQNLTYEKSFKVICNCVVMGILWPVFPLFGWSHYGLEGGLTSCSVVWEGNSLGVTSYSVAILTFVYIIPFGAIVFSNIKMVFIVKNLGSKFASVVDEKTKERIKKEKTLTIIMIVYILIFVITWTPYAIVAMASAILGDYKISPLLATLPAVIAKSSMLWSSLYFLLTNNIIRRKLMNNLRGASETKATVSMGTVKLPSRSTSTRN